MNDQVTNREQMVAELLEQAEELHKRIVKGQAEHPESFFDKLLTDIGYLKDAIKAFVSACREDLAEFSAENEKLLARLRKLKQRIDILESPPFSTVTFVRFVRMNRLPGPNGKEREVALIEVKDAHGQTGLVYLLDEDTPHTALCYGQHLRVAGSSIHHVLEAVNEYSVEGVAASIVEALPNDRNGARFLVSIREHDTPVVMHLSSAVGKTALTKGTRVLADQSARLIVEVLDPEKTSEEYLLAEVPDVTFEDIGGLDAIKAEIEETLIENFLHPKLSARMGEDVPRGAVLTGPPGVGKTMFAKAIINRLHELRCRQIGLDPRTARPIFFNIKGPELLTKWVGETERALRNLFAQGRRLATPATPVLFFFDEAESFFPIRGSGVSSDVEKTIVTTFNAEVDGITASDNVIVILATNRVDLMDSAVTRPGRFDSIITVPRPDRAGAAHILGKYLKPSWSVLHPKYNVDLYTPLDRVGRPRTGNGKVVRVQFKCDSQNVIAYLIEKTVERIFDDSARNELVTVTYEGGRKQTIRYKDLVSGARLANIVRRAKRLARRRYLDSLGKQGFREKADDFVDVPAKELAALGIEPFGVELLDMYQAVEREYEKAYVPGSYRNIHQWLTIEGLSEGLSIVQNVTVKKQATNHAD